MNNSESFVTINNVTYVVKFNYHFYVSEMKEIAIKGSHKKIRGTKNTYRILW
jgi:hypothetical protein